MKAVIVCCLIVVAAGCATNAPGAGTQSRLGSAIAPAATDPSPPAVPSLPPQPTPDFGPQLIIPATGGPPVLALPLGGALYQPLTGDPPVTGMPLFP